jgi:hypothetical protein
MPEICRFFGIVIRMFVETGMPHHLPHFHVYYQNSTAVFLIDPVEMIAGNLPRKERRLVEAWAEMHGGEMIENWRRLQDGKLPLKVVPLR